MFAEFKSRKFEANQPTESVDLANTSQLGKKVFSTRFDACPPRHKSNRSEQIKNLLHYTWVQQLEVASPINCNKQETNSYVEGICPVYCYDEGLSIGFWRLDFNAS